MHTLLLEIGTEEIPARFLPDAQRQLADKMTAALADLRLRHGAVTPYATPRRLAVIVENLAAQQEDLTEEVRGPAQRAAYDADGEPTKALLGFCRGQGVTPADTFIRDVNGTPYVFARRHQQGQPAQAVLPEALAGVITSLEFPRPMRWGSGTWRFVRPVKWLVALLDDAVLPVTVHGYEAGRDSRGHRLTRDSVTLAHARDYLAALKQAYVIADPAEREQVIRDQIAALAAEAGVTVPLDPGLLEEVVYLVEWPTAFLGSFDPAFLAVPRPVLVTSMREHQRYFPVEDAAGNLKPNFVAVRNGDADGLDIVRRGNEKVLAARLADARFFYTEDRKRPLADRVADLASVAFLDKLGTMKDKTDRIVALTARLAPLLGLSGADQETAARAALLCKADLTTGMVGEFPELQGVMGADYARVSGEPDAVATAIYEHYLPRFAGDDLPATPAGLAVAMADKLDTLAGCFALGLIPSGSQDPYGLRRQATGVVLALEQAGADVALAELTALAAAAYDDIVPLSDDNRRALDDFLAARLKHRLEEAGHRYDVVDAVLAAAVPVTVPGALARAEALTDLLSAGGPQLEAVLTACRRVGNLAEKADEAPVNADLLTEPAERALWQAYREAATRADELWSARDYAGYAVLIAGLRPAVDAFLDEVLVMAPDEAVRQARLGMLRELNGVFQRLADWTKIVREGDS